EGNRMQVSGGDLLSDVADGGDGDAPPVVILAVVHRLAAGVHARPIAAGGHPLGPSQQVCSLFRKHAAALLLIEKNDGACRKSLAARSGRGCSSIGSAERVGLCTLLLGGEDLRVQSAVEDNQEAE